MSTTTDVATPDRLEWLRATEPRKGARALRVCWPEPHQRIDKPITSVLDPTTDADLKRRADAAWEKTRAIGKVGA